METNYEQMCKDTYILVDNTPENLEFLISKVESCNPDAETHKYLYIEDGVLDGTNDPLECDTLCKLRRR